MRWARRGGTEKRMGRLGMIELLLKGLIGDEIRLNLSLNECSREFIETSEIHIPVGNVHMLNEIGKY